jgi:hypothetical protein
MFKKGPDIDKKKLLAKASDVKRDSLARLKHFNTIIEHSDFNETHSLFKSHYSFIYHTFIDTFSTFDCNSKQRRDDLESILFIFEKIIIYNPELIKKRWQFYSITFVMQKLLHQNNTWHVRQEGVRLFVLWYQILCDDQNVELRQIFASIVPNVVPKSSLPITNPSNSTQSQLQQQNAIYQQQQQHQSTIGSPTNASPQLPIKLCNIEPLVPKSPNDQIPEDETEFYLDSLLQCMVTQITKPFWPHESRKNQELGFSFIFNMFKEIYLEHLFPNFSLTSPIIHSNQTTSLSPNACYMNHSIDMYVDEVSNMATNVSPLHNSVNQPQDFSPKGSGATYKSANTRRESLHLDLKQKHQASHQTLAMSSPTSSSGRLSGEQDRSYSLSSYQAIIIKWLTRILRQDMIPGQDELIRVGGSGSVDKRTVTGGKENREPSSSGQTETDYVSTTDTNSTAIFQGIETSSYEMEVARRVIGTWPDNIALIHELFRRAFLNFYQPASMKRVVNVYKEWICSNGPNQTGSSQGGRNTKLGYTSFNDLLQIFVLNSSNAFLTKVQNPTMLDEQFEMCKRIMNIYRYMVMKIYMNTPTWEQLLEIMLMITEQLFPVIPPERKENTIGGRIAPAFFQTFIVSWIRANLYVHISSQMWYKFHSLMRDLVRWRELVEEWSTTMGSLTRVLVKHVYGLNLTDLPLERPQERRRRPKALKSFSTAEAGPKSPCENNPSSINITHASSKRATPVQVQRPPRSGSVRLPNVTQRNQTKSLTRSNSDGVMFHQLKLYYSSSISANNQASTPDKMRKIKSEYLILTSDVKLPTGDPSDSVIMTHNDAIDGGSLKDSMMLDQDHTLDSHHSGKSSVDSSSISHKSFGKRQEKSNSEKCVLLGGSVRGWTSENSIIMWRRMLGLFGNINDIEDPEIHLIAIKCLSIMLNDFMKTRDNLGISLDNQSTPKQPSLIPPYTFLFGWLLEATHLPSQYMDSRLNAYSLLCATSIRRHDMELPQQFYNAFYEAVQRGLSSSDTAIHASIIRNSTQLLSLELPGCTFLVQGLYERSRSLLLNTAKDQKDEADYNDIPRDQAVQILNAILSLNRPIRKLMVLKSEAASNSMNLVAPGDIKAKVFDTMLTCNSRPIILDSHTRPKTLCSLAMHVYNELCDNSDGLDVEKLFDTMMIELQDTSNSTMFRMNCDLLRLFADHATILTQSRPALISSLIQTVCQLIVRLSTDEKHKESIQFLLICLEDWCMAVSKGYLIKPVEQLSSSDEDETLSAGLNDSLLTIVLRSLENVINDEQYVDDVSNRGTRGSTNTSKNSDTQSSGRQSHGKSTTSSGGSQRDRTLTNNEQYANRMQQHDANASFTLDNKNLESIKLACKVSHLKLITYLGHFPFRQIGPASMSCCVNELDYLTTSDQEASDLKSLSGVLMLVIDNSTIISFIGAPRNSEGLCQPIHLIVRNLGGKYSWDASCIESSIYKQLSTADSSEKSSAMFDQDSYQEVASRSSAKYDSDFNDDGHSTSSMSSRASSSRDCIGDLLNHLACSFASANGHSISSSCQNMQRSKRNTAQSISNPRFKIAQAEETMIALLTNQRFQELNHCERSDDTDRKHASKNATAFTLSGDKISQDCKTNENSSRIVSFEQCRQLIQQLGYLSWEKRCKIDSLTKSSRLMRELKNLDAQSNRETHKIAVIYVAAGQEDKNSILTNSSGSRAFEDFVSGLGWDVNLASHLGFKGGLQANKSTGETAPYYCNSTTEVIFHVSTRIPISKPVDDESLNRKLRHLGNDEIHIVWSEHMRDYRRGIIPTEFGDVIIAIYPMLTFLGYYRVQISSKQDVPQFGPLFDNCIVHQTSLAPLVRATAINASRAKRLKLPYFQAHYEERSRLIESIVQNHKEKLSFEEFASQLYANSELSYSQAKIQGQDQCCT